MESTDDSLMFLVGNAPPPASSMEIEPSTIPPHNPPGEVQDHTPAAASPSTASSQLKIKMNSWMSVSTWNWCANDENCGICRSAFNACCPECKLPGDDCPLVWGQCSHCYHMHCIIKWLNSQNQHQNCPLCRQEWKFKE